MHEKGGVSQLYDGIEDLGVEPLEPQVQDGCDTTPASHAPNDAPHTEDLEAKLVNLSERLEASERNAAYWQERATKDSLTGLMNKEAWKTDIAERMEEGRPFGLVFMDLNSFKLINDTFSHQRGDVVLKDFGNFLGSKFHRQGDKLSHERLISDKDKDGKAKGHVASRWAGDEFALTWNLDDNDRRGIDPETGEHKPVAERVQQEVDYLQTAIDEFVESQPEDIKALGFNVSIGSAYWDPERPATPDQLFTIVDQKMYVHKKAIKERQRSELEGSLDDESRHHLTAMRAAKAALEASGLSAAQINMLMDMGRA